MSIPLSEMIQTLRQELSASMINAQDQDLRFRIGDLELELQVAVAREEQVGGKVKFWVVGANAGGKYSREDIHKFKLTLKPVTKFGGEVFAYDAGPIPKIPAG